MDSYQIQEQFLLRADQEIGVFWNAAPHTRLRLEFPRAGSYFKPVLVQVANALIKSKKHPEFTNRYKRIKARRGHKKAIIAICRMILTAIWHILSDLKPYTPEGFLESRPVKEEKILSTSQAPNQEAGKGSSLMT